jgi:hypothetical protein
VTPCNRRANLLKAKIADRASAPALARCEDEGRQSFSALIPGRRFGSLSFRTLQIIVESTKIVLTNDMSLKRAT